MELELISDQEFLAETTRKFLEEQSPVEALRDYRYDPLGFPRDLWSRGADLGWTSLLVSEANGGGSMSGRPLADLTLLAYEFGNHAAPGPLASANIVAGALSNSGSREQIEGPLADILTGKKLASWAIAEPRPNDSLRKVTLKAKVLGDNIVLDGVKAPVECATHADLLLVTCLDSSGKPDGVLTQVLVPTDAPGITVTPMASLDLTRRFAKVTFEGVTLPATSIVGDPGKASKQVDRQHQAAIAIELAQIIGAMNRAFDITVGWAFDRYSFGRPLASYQELKHRFADMKMWLEASHAISDTATRAIEDETSDVWELLSAAKAYVGHYGPELMHDCIQMHGGIGVTFEHDLHIYLRRVVLGSRLYGNVQEHRELLTKLVEQTAAVDRNETAA